MRANRLIHEQSPYLLQHAHNPVDWYPWGEEAFAKARNENRPIFLSVGYSTCHWCHVMERESFENDAIAALLNKDYVAIKVDREERPDVDRIYMTYVQATTGGGGWPMSVWLMPDLKPFLGGTYFPPEDRYGRAGFATALQRIAEAWRNDHARLVSSSAKVMDELRRQVEGGERPGAALDQALFDSAFSYWRRSFDPELGGFGQAPKFPRPVTHNFLLRYYALTRNQGALEMVLKTLREMAKGGMRDQLGGGFHRYSVDSRWFVPHFEKMLYDQAQLAISYLEAFQITRDSQFADTARNILDYVLRDMRNPEGAFYSAEDADSVIDPQLPGEKGEGAFYIWTLQEINRIAGDAAAKWLAYRYGLEPDGNVHEDPHGEFPGKNIMYEAHTGPETAANFELPLDQMSKGLKTAESKLLAARAQRVRPHLDDKVLTAWNGLMISAFAKAGAVLDNPAYTHVARVASDFIQAHLYDPRTHTLLRRFRDGDAAIAGFLDDYAFYIQGLLDLYEASFDARDLKLAIQLSDQQSELFEDRELGGFFSTTPDPQLLLRVKDDYDGAEPSGNSVAVMNLLRLSRLTGRVGFGESAKRAIHAFSGKLAANSYSLPQMLAAVLFDQSPSSQVVLAGRAEVEETAAMLNVVRSKFAPNRVVLLLSDEAVDFLGGLNPLLAEMRPIDGKTAAYYCENFTCRLPTNDPVKLAKLLQ